MSEKKYFCVMHFSLAFLFLSQYTIPRTGFFASEPFVSFQNVHRISAKETPGEI
jgi:hypothetical protein